MNSHCMIPHLYNWRGRVDIFSSDNLRGLEGENLRGLEGEIFRGLEGGILRGLEGRERERWLSLIFSITPAVQRLHPPFFGSDI